MELEAFIRDTARQKAACIDRLNRAIWDLAEFGYEEQGSSQLIADTLRAEGFAVETGIGGIPTALCASYGSGKPVIGILGEYDALPGLSQQAGVAAPSPIPGQACGHGCGHSALGAGAAGAAILVKEWLAATGNSGTVKFFGCPAEETGFGKAFLVKAGCFDGLDAAFSWHPMDINAPMNVRTVAYYKVRFDFHGRTSHAGAAPEQGRSALDACELMNVGVNYLREHVISSARIHYAYLDCGGDAPNVVQENASLLYFVRAPRLEQAAQILERVKKIAQGAALMTETEATITVLGGISDCVPNQALAQLLSDSYQAMGAPDWTEEDLQVARRFLDALPQEQRAAVVRRGAQLNGVSEEEFTKAPLHNRVIPFAPSMMDRLMTGSSDVGDVSYQVPTAQLTAAVGIPGTGAHTWQLTAQVGSSIGGTASVAAARAIALAAARLCGQPELLESAKAQLLQETGGKYLCPIPDGIRYTDVNPKAKQ